VGKDGEIRGLMARLMQAVEASLATSDAVRQALAELLRQGYEARLFFVANAGSADGGDADADTDEAPADEEAWVAHEIGGVEDEADLTSELTRLDRDFLRSVQISPEPR
jgi:hypothetical protein